jgi:hypothetical protein
VLGQKMKLLFKIILGISFIKFNKKVNLIKK